MKQPVIICDIDNTIALLNGRDPHNMDAVDQDSINPPVYNLIQFYYDFYNKQNPKQEKLEIVFVTGRDEEARDKTTYWLLMNGLPAKHLYMLPLGNTTLTNTQFKELVLNNEILPQFAPLFALDDDWRNARMYRENGVTCFQVAEREFLNKD